MSKVSIYGVRGCYSVRVNGHLLTETRTRRDAQVVAKAARVIVKRLGALPDDLATAHQSVTGRALVEFMAEYRAMPDEYLNGAGYLVPVPRSWQRVSRVADCVAARWLFKGYSGALSSSAHDHAA